MTAFFKNTLTLSGPSEALNDFVKSFTVTNISGSAVVATRLIEGASDRESVIKFSSNGPVDLEVLFRTILDAGLEGSLHSCSEEADLSLYATLAGREVMVEEEPYWADDAHQPALVSAPEYDVELHWVLLEQILPQLLVDPELPWFWGLPELTPGDIHLELEMMEDLGIDDGFILHAPMALPLPNALPVEFTHFHGENDGGEGSGTMLRVLASSEGFFFYFQTESQEEAAHE